MDFLEFEKDLDSPPDNTNKDDPDSDGDSFTDELGQFLEDPKETTKETITKVKGEAAKAPPEKTGAPPSRHDNPSPVTLGHRQSVTVVWDAKSTLPHHLLTGLFHLGTNE